MDRYYQVTPTVPANTSASAPFEVFLDTEDALLIDVEIVIPRGHTAQTGIRILQSRQQILPWGNLSWITGHGYSRVFEVNNEVGRKSLSVQTYNVDFRSHTFYVRFHLRDIGDTHVMPLTPDQLAAQGVLGLTSAST